VVGFKPSYGLISRHGVVAYADSLDCVGILARKTSDVRDVFGIVSQPDENDMTCVSASDRAKAAAAVAPSLDVRPLRIGIPVQTHLERPNIQLNPALLEHLRARGATLHAVDMPSFAMALPAYYVLACAEAASNLGRFGGSWYGSTAARERVQPGDEVDQRDASGAARRSRLRTQGFGDEVRKRILAGTHALTADAFNNSYLKALQLRRAVRRDFAAVLRTPHPITGGEAPEAGVDVLLFPTAVGTAPVLGAAESGESGTNEYLQDLLTVPASLAGLPAISVPAGKGQDGWPVGVSLVGQWGCDEAVFRAAQEVEAWQQ
jgi:aspartyl-tRNA(Asn)/glutamyl-tRNA(Gln) amidotransferase subunit A